MTSGMRASDEARAVAPDVVLRPATPDDCRRIAELFRVASDGVADYIWSRLQPEHPGALLVEIGTRRYQRENTAFSYQTVWSPSTGRRHRHDARLRDRAGRRARARRETDPVLRPYAELELPGSLYISAIAVVPRYRGQGIGTRFLAAARERARREGCPALSLICLDQNEGAKRLYERAGCTILDRRDVVPHRLIHATGTALLMSSPVEPEPASGTGAGDI